MRCLLDTHILIWAVAKSSRLPPSVRELLEDTANEIMFSAASIWEIAIKTALGKPEFDIRPEQIAIAARATGFVELPVSAEAAASVVDLPLYHRDPFDRLLVAQAISGPMLLYTADPLLGRYSELVHLVE